MIKLIDERQRGTDIWTLLVVKLLLRLENRRVSIDCHRSGPTDNKGIFFGTFLGLNNEYEEISFQIFCSFCKNVKIC